MFLGYICSSKRSCEQTLQKSYFSRLPTQWRRYRMNLAMTSLSRTNLRLLRSVGQWVDVAVRTDGMSIPPALLVVQPVATSSDCHSIHNSIELLQTVSTFEISVKLKTTGSMVCCWLTMPHSPWMNHLRHVIGLTLQRLSQQTLPSTVRQLGNVRRRQVSNVFIHSFWLRQHGPYN